MDVYEQFLRVEKDLEGMQIQSTMQGIIAKAQAMHGDAIPLEQLKGDLAREGHPVKQAIALDAESRRLFFTDIRGEHLYAEFAGPDDGHRVTLIGHQASIAKEYDPTDLDVSEEEGNQGESVTTEHDEEDEVETPGMYPGSTPGDKPEDDDRGFAADKLLKELLEHR